MAEPRTMQDMVEQLFSAQTGAHADGSIGAELELIPMRDSTSRRVPIVSRNQEIGTAEIIRWAAAANAWNETIDAYGAPSWSTSDGSRISYEPGGQIEISSPVLPSPPELQRSLAATVAALREAGGTVGISLLTNGVDPYNAIADVPLQLQAPRYEAMTRYFDSVGPSGVRMMRQTASLQVSVELGPSPMERWALLNALSPYLLAASANSSVYAGHATGYASYRARLWQTLDSSRTGIPFERRNPIGAYTTFAVRAGRILSDDAAHLTTLFPEVRPRGYFEIRSMDAMESDRAGDMLRLIYEIVHRADLAEEARTLLGDPDPDLLAKAALRGRMDPIIGQRLDALERLV